MNISLKIASAVALTSLVFSGAANAASVNGTASVDIATPISISQTSAMSFGTVAATTGTSSAVLTPAGGMTGTSSLGGTISAATFNVQGTSGSTYSISLPTADVTLSSANSSMIVNAFTHDAGVTPTLTGGSVNFNVGATLNIGANQAAGSYTGTYAVTTNYN